MSKANVYSGFWRNTIVKVKPIIIDNFVIRVPCLECGGSGIFDCGIKEQKGICICCKGTGVQYVGTL